MYYITEYTQDINFPFVMEAIIGPKFEGKYQIELNCRFSTEKKGGQGGVGAQVGI